MKYSKEEIESIIKDASESGSSNASTAYALEAIAKMMYNKMYGKEKSK
jgi:hypothetical protein